MFKTAITEMFGIKYPIICGAMMWLCKPKLCGALMIDHKLIGIRF